MYKYLTLLLLIGCCSGSVRAQTDLRLFGTTFFGGNRHDGVLFSTDSTGRDLQLHHEFDVSEGGIFVNNALVQVNDSTLIGTAGGGDFDVDGYPDGVIFRLNLNTNAYQVLYRFAKASGRQPTGQLVNLSGRLYGTASSGGDTSGDGHGLIYSFDYDTRQYRVQYRFTGNEGGSYPQGGLTLAADGKLYGTTHEGGHGSGNIYRFDPITKQYTNLVNMDGSTGFRPTPGALLAGKDGRLYGTNYSGVNGEEYGGNLFSLDPRTAAYTIAADFDSLHIGEAVAPLVQAPDGNLYGTVRSVNPYHYGGALYRYDIAKRSLQNLAIFYNPASVAPPESWGYTPNGPVYVSPDGMVYGCNTKGGTSDSGACYRFNIRARTIETLLSFTGPNGGVPYDGLVPIRVKRRRQSVEGVQRVTDLCRVYPNPAAGDFNIRLDVSGVERVVVLDAQGRKVVTVFPKVGEQNVLLQPEQYRMAPGLYQINVYTAAAVQSVPFIYTGH